MLNERIIKNIIRETIDELIYNKDYINEITIGQKYVIESKTNKTKSPFKEHVELNMLLEDKRTNTAKKQCLHIIRNHFNNASWLDTLFNHNDNPEGLTYIDYMFKQFMSEFYHNPDYRKKATMRLAPLFCRLAFESNFQNNNPDTTKLNRLLSILNFIYQLMEKNKLDVSKISLDLTYEELNNQFGTQIDQMNKDEDERMNNAQYTKNSEYTVIGPVDFKTANEYGNYSCPSSKLCYTRSEGTWNSYTENGENSVYIILKNGWENIEANHDDNSNSAYDAYGLSMIFVFVGEEGELEYCNTRWNHQANYAQGFSCDHAMSREMISELIGRPFNEVFKPSNALKKKIEALKNMTEIPNGYFKNSKIKEITIPNNITSIGDYAFSNCYGLKKVYCYATIPPLLSSDVFSENARGRRIYVYEECVELYKSDMAWSRYEDSIYTNGQNCPSTTTIEYTTNDGNTITSSKLPILSNSYEDGVGRLITAKIEKIPANAFRHCSGLTNVNLPESVTSIGKGAFAFCSSLTSITIPESVTEIGEAVFYDCSSLREFRGKVASEDGRCLIVDGVLNLFAPAGLTEYTIPNSVTSIGKEAFYYCSNLKSITIPESVTSIGDYAFGYCSRLTSITIPNSVTEIGAFAFQVCRSLTSVTIPNSVTEIGSAAFYDCSRLTSITIPNSVTILEYYTFYGCESLKEIILPIRFRDDIRYIFGKTNANIRYYEQQNESLNKNKVSRVKYRITENDLRKIIGESIKKIFKEGLYDNFR